MNIEAISGEALTYRTVGQSVAAHSPSHFSQVLTRYIEQTNQELLQANSALQDLANGQAPSVHQVMIELEEARLQFQTLVQIRNRVLDAYQDVMRMSI